MTESEIRETFARLGDNIVKAADDDNPAPVEERRPIARAIIKDALSLAEELLVNLHRLAGGKP